MPNLSVRFTDEEHDKLRLMAAKLHVAGKLTRSTITALVRAALREYLDKNEA